MCSNLIFGLVFWYDGLVGDMFGLSLGFGDIFGLWFAHCYFLLCFVHFWFLCFTYSFCFGGWLDPPEKWKCDGYVIPHPV